MIPKRYTPAPPAVSPTDLPLPAEDAPPIEHRATDHVFLLATGDSVVLTVTDDEPAYVQEQDDRYILTFNDGTVETLFRRYVVSYRRQSRSWQTAAPALTAPPQGSALPH